MPGIEKISDGVYFIVDPQYLMVSITPYNNSVANQMICYGWDEPIDEPVSDEVFPPEMNGETRKKQEEQQN